MCPSAAGPGRRRALRTRPSNAAAALDYDDLIVATRRLLSSHRECGLGALQARWRPRSRAGRRGAGHQSRPMGSDPQPHRAEFFAGRRRGRPPCARSLPWAMPSSRSSASSAPIHASSPKCATWFAAAHSRRSGECASRPVDLTVSFRSTPAVLDAVDCRIPPGRRRRQGRGAASDAVEHVPIRTGQPGVVELWPLVRGARSEADPTDLDADPGALPPPHERLARMIALHAKSLIGHERRSSTGKLLNPATSWCWCAGATPSSRRW